jgi:hypothetical protein
MKRDQQKPGRSCSTTIWRKLNSIQWWPRKRCPGLLSGPFAHSARATRMRRGCARTVILVDSSHIHVCCQRCAALPQRAVVAQVTFFVRFLPSALRPNRRSVACGYEPATPPPTASPTPAFRVAATLAEMVRTNRESVNHEQMAADLASILPGPVRLAIAEQVDV